MTDKEYQALYDAIDRLKAENKRLRELLEDAGRCLSDDDDYYYHHPKASSVLAEKIIAALEAKDWRPMPLELDKRELEFLRSQVKQYLEYYSILAANSQASEFTKSQFAFVSKLWQKLGPGNEHDPRTARSTPGSQSTDLFP